ncbi:hypothetical protein F5Y16DRAFT_394652 [Xylariaceae sp. FL0255]|nr:hypothetical protein F5Y16DRAFT_394652 [Xylariaceae sp. FL0255]
MKDKESTSTGLHDRVRDLISEHLDENGNFDGKYLVRDKYQTKPLEPRIEEDQKRKTDQSAHSTAALPTTVHNSFGPSSNSFRGIAHIGPYDNSIDTEMTDAKPLDRKRPREMIAADYLTSIYDLLSKKRKMDDSFQTSPSAAGGPSGSGCGMGTEVPQDSPVGQLKGDLGTVAAGINETSDGNKMVWDYDTLTEADMSRMEKERERERERQRARNEDFSVYDLLNKNTGRN